MTTWLEGKLASSNDPAAPTTSTRAVDTQWANASGWVLGNYTIEITITSGQDCTVDARCDAADPPVTSRGSARSNVVGIVRQHVTMLIPPGTNAKLVKSGTGTATIVSQTEDVIS